MLNNLKTMLESKGYMLYLDNKESIIYIYENGKEVLVGLENNGLIVSLLENDECSEDKNFFNVISAYKYIKGLLK